MNRNRLHIFVIIVAVAGTAWLGWDSVPHDGGSPGTPLLSTPCPVKLATGIPCPSCGTTRAVAALAAGDLAGSLGMNPFGLIVALALLVFPVWVLHDVLRSRDGFHRFYLAFDRTFERHRWLAISCAALVAANWGWNILKGF